MLNRFALWASAVLQTAIRGRSFPRSEVRGYRNYRLSGELCPLGSGVLAGAIEYRFGYDLSISLDTIRPYYSFDLSCQGTVPVAIRAFLESWCYEDAIRNAVSVGGNSDTIAAITGGIEVAYYKEMPDKLVEAVENSLTPDMEDVCKRFAVDYPL